MKSITQVNLINFRYDGHRPSYSEVLTTALASRGIQLINTAAGSDADFFPMLDDNKTKFVRLALHNSFARRRTVALFFRPMECFLTSKLTYKIKRLLFRCLHFLPNTYILTILPFDIERRFSLIATDWIYDPQFWDLEYLATPARTDDELRIQQTVGEIAQGRQVVVALGAQNKIKGFEFFSRLWAEHPELRDHYLFVAAGKVDRDCQSSAEQFVRTQGLLFDRSLSDSELLALYQVADGIWSCYAPNYNQSSGIFGRAFQFSKPSIVREGSFLTKIAESLDHPILSLPFYDPDVAAHRLMSWQPAPGNPSATRKKIEQIRDHALQTLTRTLLPQKPLSGSNICDVKC